MPIKAQEAHITPCIDQTKNIKPAKDNSQVAYTDLSE